jgi:hypothetical protein
MGNKKNLWVFGDSFSVPFKKIENESPYISYKGYCPKIYSNIISEELGLNLMDMSMGGCSNQSIVHKYIKNIDLINPNDTVIFGWTQPIRFRIGSKRNDFYDVIIAVAPHMQEFIDMSIDSLNDITINRSKYSIFWDELIDYVNLINKTLKCKSIHHWTWVNPTDKIDTNLYESQFYDLLLPFKKYSSVREETNGIIDDFHYGELGHSQLAKDLLSKIRKII